MNNNIEDTHILMQIRNMFEHLKNHGWINDIKREINSDKAIQAIENILADRERLEKENNRLTYARNWYFEHTVGQIATPEMLNKILRTKYNMPELQTKANAYDSLVQIIKNKKAEIEKYIVEQEEKTIGRCITIGEDMMIKYLQELLDTVEEETCEK